MHATREAERGETWVTNTGGSAGRRGITVLNLVLLILAVIVVAVLVSRQL